MSDPHRDLQEDVVVLPQIELVGLTPGGGALAHVVEAEPGHPLHHHEEVVLLLVPVPGPHHPRVVHGDVALAELGEDRVVAAQELHQEAALVGILGELLDLHSLDHRDVAPSGS